MPDTVRCEEPLSNNIVTYYAPTLFQTSLGMSQHLALLLGALLQVWYLGASFVTWYTIDRVGRRKLLILNALGMCVVLVAEAICVSINSTPSAIAAVVFVFAFEACFTWGECRLQSLDLCADSNRLDGDGLVLSPGNPAIENPRKGCSIGSCCRLSW